MCLSVLKSHHATASDTVITQEVNVSVVCGYPPVKVVTARTRSEYEAQIIHTFIVQGCVCYFPVFRIQIPYGTLASLYKVTGDKGYTPPLTTILRARQYECICHRQ